MLVKDNPCDYQYSWFQVCLWYFHDGYLYGIIMITFSYLWSGTGYPCDWHNKTISDFARRLKIVPFESDENVGDFIPTGSKNKLRRKIIYWDIDTRKVDSSLAKMSE